MTLPKGLPSQPRQVVPLPLQTLQTSTRGALSASAAVYVLLSHPNINVQSGPVYPGWHTHIPHEHTPPLAQAVGQSILF